jgi:hypothetical protein
MGEARHISAAVLCIVGSLASCTASGIGDDGGPPDRMIIAECAASSDCTDPQQPICSPEAICAKCKEDGECKALDASAPLCAADGACVGCRGAADCEDDTAPVCDTTTRSCRACAADAECESGACDLDEGRCFPATDVYVVDDGGPCGSGDGTPGSPFCSIEEAMTAFSAAPRNFISVRDGSYHFPPLASAPLPWFLGTPDALITPASAGGDCLKLDSSALMQLRGFHFKGCATAIRVGATASQVSISGSQIDTSTYGIDCKARRCVVSAVQIRDTTMGVRCGSGSRCSVDGSSINGGDTAIWASGATVDVHDTSVTRARVNGLNVADSELEVVHTTVRETGKGGTGPTVAVVCSGSYCTFDRARIVGSRGAGLVLQNSNFEIYSSAVLGNGSQDASLPQNGGVVLLAPGATRVFQNNTVVGNRAAIGATGGVRCQAAVQLRSSIVWGNSGLPVDPLCTATYSDIDTAAVLPGVGNLRIDPKLTSITPGAMDEHIAPDSPCIDAGDPAGGPTADIDGQARPNHGRVDIGADEIMF